MKVERPPADPVASHLSRARRIELSAPARRAVPDPGRIARRARVVRWSKYLLPVAALLLLGSVALWPEINRQMRLGRAALRDDEAVAARDGTMLGPEYHGIDGHGRPYMISAVSADEASPDRVNLDRPVADITAGPGVWLEATADRGVYAPHGQMLDLGGHVVLYRADGTILTGPVATLDLRRSVAFSPTWVHIEGPFGVLDAQSAFMASGDGVLQFAGPARAVLNDAKGSGR